MKLSNKNILIVSPQAWDHIFVSKHHYAIHLAKRGNNVIFLNPPSDKWKSSNSDYQNLQILDYSGFWNGLRHLPKFLRKRNQLGVFKKIENLLGLNIDVVWSFDNSVFFDLDALPKRSIKISHIVDLNMNFEVKRAASTADICFGVTSLIVDRSKIYNSNTHLVGHGLNIGHRKKIENLNLPDKSNHKAVYLGNLAMKHLDWNVLLEATEMNSNFDFIFIGPGLEDETNKTSSAKRKLQEYDNVYFMPKIESNEVQGYLELASVLLLTYQEEYHQDQTNSHKILEYLYSGKPIVATFTQEYVGKDLMYMSKKNAEWPSLFEYVVENLEVFSSKELADKRKKYAMEHTYDKQIDRIEKLLTSLPA